MSSKSVKDSNIQRWLEWADTQQEEKKAVSKLTHHNLPTVDDILGNKVVGIPCRKCHNNGVTYRLVQLRSGDEGMTAIFTCPKCGHNWKE